MALSVGAQRQLQQQQIGRLLYQCSVHCSVFSHCSLIRLWEWEVVTWVYVCRLVLCIGRDEFLCEGTDRAGRAC